MVRRSSIKPSRKKSATLLPSAFPLSGAQLGLSANPQWQRPKDNQNPSYYREHPAEIECISVIQWFPCNPANAIKYIWRAGLKLSSNELEDLRKARWYIEQEINRLEYINAKQASKAQDPT